MFTVCGSLILEEHGEISEVYEIVRWGPIFVVTNKFHHNIDGVEME